MYFVQCSRGQKSEIGISGMGSFWKLRENLFHASPSFWYPGNPWPALASGGITLIPASIFTWLCVSVSLLSSLIRTPVMELGPTLNQYDLMLICWTIYYMCKTLFPNMITFWGSWGLWILEDTNSTPYTKDTQPPCSPPFGVTPLTGSSLARQLQLTSDLRNPFGQFLPRCSQK